MVKYNKEKYNLFVIKIKKELIMNIGLKIKKLRKEKNITQQHLAEILDVSYQAISRWENNITSPDITVLPILSNIFNVTIDYLLDNKIERFNNEKKKVMETR